MLCNCRMAPMSRTPPDRTHQFRPDAWMKPGGGDEAAVRDLPEGAGHTLVVAQRCAVMAPKRKPILPACAGDIDGRGHHAARSVEKEGRKSRWAGRPGWRRPGSSRTRRRPTLFERLKFEYWTSSSIWASRLLPDRVPTSSNGPRDHDIPGGPGRGSGAGSLVAWALTITDLAPLQLGLLFERFLNPERVSMPDFDIDFCETRRGEVIRYVQQKYGSDHVAQIITFGKLKARAVLKDTGRVMQMSYGQVDRLAKLVPNHPTDPWTLERSLNGVAEFKAEYDNDNQVKRLIDYAMKLEGFPRHSSTHAAGVVIGDRPLSQLVPLYRDPRSDTAGDPVRHEVRRGCGLGEVRLSRPQDAVGAAKGGAVAQGARGHGRSRHARLGRCQGL